MIRKWFVFILLGTLAYGQAASVPVPPASTQPAATATEKPAEPQVAPTDPVITVQGVCADASKTGDSCKTVITKEQFEKLANSLQPNMTLPVRRQLATAYARMLVMTAEAEKRGLDKRSQFDETLRFARMQILSQQLTRDLQEDSQKVPDADIEKYYKENAGAYDEATLLRIFIPKSKQIPPPEPAVRAGKGGAAKPAVKEKPIDPAAREKAAQEAMTKVAADLRARAVNGEDVEKLQKEAFVSAGLKSSAPPTKMDKVRQTTLPRSHKSVIDLKPGEVSAVIDDPSGHYIYKLVSKQTLSLDAVKPEIRNTMSSQRYRDAMQPFQASPDLNQAYFGEIKNPALPLRPGQPPSKPTQGDDDDPD